MLKIAISLLSLIACFVNATQTVQQKELQLVASHYQLAYQLNLEQQILSANGKIKVRNISQKKATFIPFRLYRLLSVDSIITEDGTPLSFTQQVISNEDWSLLQTNYVEVKLPKPIEPSGEFSFTISFKGALHGYVETGMTYVKDTISPSFSIIRMDAFAYPVVSLPDDSANKQSKFWLHHYDYDVAIQVPSSHVVANGGELVSIDEAVATKTYRYKNKLPAWRMDFAIAKYKRYVKGNYAVFSWEDDADTLQLLEQIEKAFTLYTKWFGPLKRDIGYTFIEVPENYGAQADVTSVIQDAAGFKELKRVYHEVSHQWNVKSLDAFSPRWNEGLATFLQELTVEKFGRPEHSRLQIEKTLDTLKERINHNTKYASTPFRNFGKEGLSAYTVGHVFFQLIYDLVGEKQFNQIIGGFYQTYHNKGATTDEFIRFALNHSTIDLTRLFDEWANSPTWAQKVLNCQGYAALLATYQG